MNRTFRQLCTRANLPSLVILLIIGVSLFTALAGVIYLVFDRERIHGAVKRNDLVEVNRIIDRNPARLEQRNRLGLTPFLTAAWEGNVEVLVGLVGRGANIHSTWDTVATEDGRWSALHIAALRGHSDTARVLLKAGVDINATTLKGETPLDIALRNHNRDVAALLQSNGGVRGGNR